MEDCCGGTDNARGLFELPVSAGSTPTVTADWDSFREWYPGIKQGRLQVRNSRGGSGQRPVATDHGDVARQAGFGVWLLVRTELGRRADVPDDGVLDGVGGSTSDIYTMGAYTAGGDGSCAATNNTDVWRGYLVITPENHPADARLVRLRLNADMTVDVENQAGGPMAVSVRNIVGGDPPVRRCSSGGVRIVAGDG